MNSANDKGDDFMKFMNMFYNPNFINTKDIISIIDRLQIYFEFI